MKKPTKTKPPSNGALKLPPEFLARVGQPRTCESCGDSKPITFKTFASSKASPDRVSPVCRVCQGRAAREKQINAGKPTASEEATIRRLTDTTRYPDPTASKRDERDYFLRVDEATARMYEAALDPKRDAETAALVAALSSLSRLPSDPMPGVAANEHVAFLTFARVVKPLISRFTDFAPCHTEIINALLSHRDKTLCLASRNSGKSTVAQIWMAWLLHRNPLLIVLVVSAGASLAKRIMNAVRRLIDGCPLLAPLRPTDDCPDSLEAFTVPAALGRLGASTSFASFGITSKITGRRADVLLLDDIESRKDDTPEAQENLDNLCAEFEHLLNPGARVVGLGTPQVEGISIYGRWVASGEYELFTARLFIEHDEGGRLPVLESLWEERWPTAELERKRRNMPVREWKLHMLCDLSAAEGDARPIKLRQFVVVPGDPMAATFPTIVKPGGPKLEHLPTFTADSDDAWHGPSFVSADTARWVSTIVAIDPASGLAGRDALGLCVLGVTVQGRAVVRCLRGIRAGSATETLEKAAILTASFLPTKIIVEARADSLFPSQFATVLARRGYPCLVQPVRSGEAKGVRILDSITVPLADQRVLILDRAITENEDAGEMVKQLTGITRDARSLRHDDIVDALAWALATAAPLLRVEAEDNLPSLRRQKVEELFNLPLRMGGLSPDDPLAELLLADDEHEEFLKQRLDRLLETQADELRRGIVDHSFAAHIEAARKELADYRR
jgi:hypothetical protein